MERMIRPILTTEYHQTLQKSSMIQTFKSGATKEKIMVVEACPKYSSRIVLGKYEKQSEFSDKWARRLHYHIGNDTVMLPF